MLKYKFPADVEAFTAGKGEELPYAVLQPHQVHLDKIVVIDEDFIKSLQEEGATLDSDEARERLQSVDALVTNLPETPIGVRTADCVPVLLYDPENKVVAAIHCGWRGTVQKLSQKTISVMRERFSTDPAKLFAAIGPSISVDAFQVGEEVVKTFEKAGFPMEQICEIRHGEEPLSALAEAIIPRQMRNGYHIDLWKANSWLLTEVGVDPHNIEVSGICTYQHFDKYYSARKEGNQKGLRNINFIKLVHK